MRRELWDRGWLLASLTVAACLLGAWSISLAISIPDEDDFNVVYWEIRHIPGKWLYLTGEFINGELSEAQEDERLGQFLLVAQRIEEIERSFVASDAGELQRLVHQRDELENDVEAIIEGRLTALLAGTGLDSSLPLFPNARWVFPPVDVEFDEAPRSLTISPRDRIELVDRRPLRPGLSLDEAVEREAEMERTGDVSALVGSLSGAATYPSIVAPRGDYRLFVSTIAHEWVHHYLFFKPLGGHYYDSIALRTLNETVADIAGDALAAMFVERHPLPMQITSQFPPPREAPDVDVDAFLRELRLDVESLLTAGQIEVAEALMEERRLELVDQGVVFRRINQAFFAARGIYATTPGSVDPTGPKLRALFQQSDDVGEFLRAAARFTATADLDMAIEDGEARLE